MNFSSFIAGVRRYPVSSTLIAVLFALAFFLNVGPLGEQQFTYLAQSFLEGKLYFVDRPGTWADSVFWNGRYFWPLGPLPAMLLMPFVFAVQSLGIFFFQGYLLFFITLAVFIIWYNIARARSYSPRDAVLLATTFVFGSGYILVALASWSWYFAQAITVCFMSAALLEYLTKKRFSVIGVLMAGVVMTRMTAGIGILFFMFDILFLSQKPWSEKRRNFIALLAPFFIGIGILALYNVARFGDPLVTGYGSQLLLYEPIRKACTYGAMSLIHIPGNLYYLLLAAPLPVLLDGVSRVLTFPFLKPDSWGMSIFITSPYLAHLFFMRFKRSETWALLVTSACILAPLLLYCGVGYNQYGYRYALDFFPLLFLIFIGEYYYANRGLSRIMRLVLIASILINVSLVTIFLSLP